MFLGCKSRQEARIHTFHALLLSRQSSPFAIFNALLRSDLLTRLYFRHCLSTKAGALPNDRAIPRDKARVKASSVCLLLVLLVTPPIMNMCLVGITVESKRVVSFREAKFGGLALGIVENGSKLRKQQMTEDCGVYEVEKHAHDEVTAQVVLCRETHVTKEFSRVREFRGKSQIVLLVVDEVKLLMRVSTRARDWERYYSAYISTRSGENLLLKGKVGRQEGRALVKRGMEIILETFKSNFSVEDTLEFHKHTGLDLQGYELIWGRNGADFGAELETEEEGVTTVFAEMDRVVTLVRTKEMIVNSTGKGRGGATFDAGDREFLRRGTRIAGMGVLALVTAVVIVARAAVGLLVRNDVNDGIERMVKERVGQDYCDMPLNERFRTTILRFSTKRFELANREN